MSGPIAQARLQPLPDAALSAAQRRVVDAITQGPRGRLSGPFVALLRSPELCQRTQLLGEYLRYDSSLPPRLRELAILATARHWRQDYEWNSHAPLAERAGSSARAHRRARRRAGHPIHWVPMKRRCSASVTSCIEIMRSVMPPTDARGRFWGKPG